MEVVDPRHPWHMEEECGRVVCSLWRHQREVGDATDEWARLISDTKRRELKTSSVGGLVGLVEFGQLVR